MYTINIILIQFNTLFKDKFNKYIANINLILN